MKYLAIFFTTIAASSTYANKPINPLSFEKIAKYDVSHGITIVHYCNFGTVYAQELDEYRYKHFNQSTDQMITLTAMLWDHENGTPLKCKDYESKVSEIYSNYKVQKQKYEQENPTKPYNFRKTPGFNK